MSFSDFSHGITQKQVDTSTTNEMFSGQIFAIMATFCCCREVQVNALCVCVLEEDGIAH